MGEFVHAQKQAYLGNRQPYLTIHAICELEELYAYGHWKQALRRRSGIDAKDATPQQIATFKRKIQFLNTSTEREREAKREAKDKRAILHDPFGGDWTDDLGLNGCPDFYSFRQTVVELDWTEVHDLGLLWRGVEQSMKT